MQRIIRLFYRFVGWLCTTSTPETVHSCIGRFLSSRNGRYCLISTVRNERCFHQKDRTKQAFPTHIQSCNYWKKGPLEFCSLSSTSEWGQEWVQTRFLRVCSSQSWELPRMGISLPFWVLLHCPMSPAALCHEQHCSPLTAARLIPAQLSVSCSFTAVPANFPGFSQNPAAVAVL